MKPDLLSIRRIANWLKNGGSSTPTFGPLPEMLEEMADAVEAGLSSKHLAAGAVSGDKLAAGAYRRLTVYSAVALTVGQLLHSSGYNAATACLVVENADADAGKPAQLVAVEVNAGSATSEARDIYTLTGVNTNAATVGDPVYGSTTAGGWTLTAPGVADSQAWIVGRVSVKSATVGEIVFDLARKELAAIGTSNLQDDAVSTAKIADNAVTGPLLAAGAFLSAVVTGSNGAGACALVGAKVGDKVVMNVNLSDATDDQTSFETTITVVDQIQQTSASDLSTKKFAVLLVVKS